MGVSVPAFGLPLSPDLFGIHDAIGGKYGVARGIWMGLRAPAEMPPVS